MPEFMPEFTPGFTPEFTPQSMPRHLVIRRVVPADRDALRAMQTLSLCVLGGDFYAPAQLASFIAEFGTMDEFLLSEGTYYVAEWDGRIVASGGWSRNVPAYARRIGAADALPGIARIRSVFVHPGYARRGIARLLVARAEAEARAAGFLRIELTASLSGVPLYRALGFRARHAVSVPLSGGLAFPAVAMEKALTRASAPAEPSWRLAS